MIISSTPGLHDCIPSIMLDSKLECTCIRVDKNGQEVCGKYPWQCHAISSLLLLKKAGKKPSTFYSLSY